MKLSNQKCIIGTDAELIYIQLRCPTAQSFDFTFSRLFSAPKTHSPWYAIESTSQSPPDDTLDSRRRPAQPLRRVRKAPAQAQAPRTVPQLVLHGRQMPRYASARILLWRKSERDARIGCFTITTVFSHAHTVVLCGSCASVLCQPTGGKARLTEGASPLPFLLIASSNSPFSGCSFRRKN
jgi:small subunit ribosomal protein S27e